MRCWLHPEKECDSACEAHYTGLYFRNSSGTLETACKIIATLSWISDGLLEVSKKIEEMKNK